MISKCDYIIVGAGIFGSVVAERLASSGKKICIIDKRPHIAGNCYDEIDSDTNILVHKYGPHIFHTSNSQVLNYVERFSKFNRYFHRVITLFQGRAYPLPFNLETINSFYDITLKPTEVQSFIAAEIEKEQLSSPPKNMEEKALSLIGRKLYEAFIKDYTIKQWGKEPCALPADIINRIPVRQDYYGCYYNDTFCGLPARGYTDMVSKILDHENISVFLNTNFFDILNDLPSGRKIVFTGPIDQYFNYRNGRLAYRKVTFQKEIHNVRDWQGTSVINYPESKYDYTRICEPRHFYREKWDQYAAEKTVIFKETPSQDDGSDPYYPINDQENTRMLQEYQSEAKQLKNVFFGGRLGSYKYYDMDTSIAAALVLSKQLISRHV